MGRSVVTGRQASPSLGGEGIEHVEVEPVEHQAITRVGSLDAVRPQQAPHAAEVHGDVPLGLGGQVGTGPQAVDEVIDRDAAAPVHRQHLEGGAGLATPQLAQVDARDLERAEHPDAQRAGIGLAWLRSVEGIGLAPILIHPSPCGVRSRWAVSQT